MTFCKGRSPRGCSRRVPAAEAQTPEMCSKTAEKAAHSVQGNGARKGSEEGTALRLDGKSEHTSASRRPRGRGRATWARERPYEG